MKDPKTNLEVFEPNIIKTVSLEYCVNLLNERNFYDEHKDYYYLQDMIHFLRCRDDSRDDSELTKEDFEKRLKILNTKCKEKYKYILKSGDGYRSCLFDLFSRVWKSEDKPQQWRNTIIVQIYKGKGDFSGRN